MYSNLACLCRNMIRFLFILLSVAYTTGASAQNLHQAWHTLLQQHVSAQGKVNYTAFKRDKNALDTYLKALREAPVEKLSRSEQLAYWINLYNAATVQMILENYPLKSITHLYNGKPWDVKRIQVGDSRYSLNEIENDIIRPQFKEPRIHFALNCAAKSCPPLWNQAFTAQNIEKALTDRTRNFLRDRKANLLSKNQIQLSKIFEWYAPDFGNVITFLNRYSNITISDKANLQYLPYNWDLNTL